MQCAPHEMRFYFLYIHSRSYGFAKKTAKQPIGLFGLLIPLLFLAVGYAFCFAKRYPPLGYCWHTMK